MTAKTRRSRKQREPLDIKLTVAFRFGDEPEDRVTVMKDRSVPLVGTIFESRDAVLRGFSRLLLKAARLRPKVAAEVLPVVRILRPRRGDQD